MFEFVKGNKKIIYIIIITIILFIVMSYLINSCTHSAISGLMNENISENIKKLSMNVESDAQEVLKGIAIKNGDWSSYPLSKEFLEKYNSKDGIFPQYSFEEVSGHKLNEEVYSTRYENVPKNQEQNKLGGIFHFRIGYGLTMLWENSVRNIDIAYYINGRGELNDFTIIYDKQTVDEKGEPIIEYNKEFKPNNTYMIAQILFYDTNLGITLTESDLFNIDKEPISERCKNKVRYAGIDEKRVFIDFFPEIDYTFGALYYGIIKNKEEAFEQKKIYATCQKFEEGKEPYYDEPEKIYLYEVNFQLDNQNKLDDISVKYVKEISYAEYLKQYE